MLCGVCVDRKPIISRAPTKIEIDFQNMLYEIENQNSKKSEHEIRHEADQRRAEEFKKGKVSTEDLDKAIGESAVEFEDRNKKELMSFQPAPRITEADTKNDTKSTERKLDKHLLLIVKEKLGAKDTWIVPQDMIREGESLRTAAERILREKCGSGVKVKFYGNAPSGFYKYKYPKPVKNEKGSVGAKIFFIKAQYLKGAVDQNTIKDYSWASRDELKDHFQGDYCKSIEYFLIDDENPVEENNDNFY